MDTYSINEKILKEYKNIFFEILEKNIPISWQQSALLFKFCLSNNKLNIAKKFDVFHVMDQEYLKKIEKNINKIINVENKKEKMKNKELSWIDDEKDLKEYYCFNFAIPEIIKKYYEKLFLMCEKENKIYLTNKFHKIDFNSSTDVTNLLEKIDLAISKIKKEQKYNLKKLKPVSEIN